MNVPELERQIEEKPAPEPLLAVQAFANTLDIESGTDLLETPELFVDWLRRSELAVSSVTAGPSELEVARRLRGVLRDLLVANERDTTDPEAGRVLAELASRYRVQLVADPETGELAPDTSPATDVADFACLILGIVLEAQQAQTWGRLKLCENPDCLWAFYDSSRNRSGSWCRTGLCGNRLKNRAYRERRRAG
jgi:predicted RNA-binding Zn ribbon-like protein